MSDADDGNWARDWERWSSLPPGVELWSEEDARVRGIAARLMGAVD